MASISLPPPTIYAINNPPTTVCLLWPFYFTRVRDCKHCANGQLNRGKNIVWKFLWVFCNSKPKNHQFYHFYFEKYSNIYKIDGFGWKKPIKIWRKFKMQIDPNGAVWTDYLSITNRLSSSPQPSPKILYKHREKAA